MDNKFDIVFTKYNTQLNDDNIRQEVNNLLAKHKQENDNKEVKKYLLGCVELTSLKPTDNEESIMKLVEGVNSLDDKYPHLPHVATICVYPNFAQTVNETLRVEGVEIACVAGGFPSAQTFMEVKIAEVALALKDGATEIDTVMSVGKFISGDYESIENEIEESKAICGERKLKVILETGCLPSMSDVKKAALLAMYSGADFIKTSTGKEKVSATPEAAYVMCKAIKEYYEETGIAIGFKVAGGLNTVDDAINYYTIVKEILGENWLDNNLFRIGTSRLANVLLSEIEEEEIKLF